MHGKMTDEVCLAAGLLGDELAPGTTYWCQHCHRTFAGSDARPDVFGGEAGCAFEDCRAAGLGIDIFEADSPYVLGEPRYKGTYALDYGLRDEILGVEANDDLDDIMPFQDVDVVQLATLFAGRYLNPDMHQNRAPTTLECMTFLCRWPEVTVHGYALHPDREGDGGDVRIEGFACHLDLVDAARRDALRAAFRAFSKADTFIDEPDFLYAWWD